MRKSILVTILTVLTSLTAASPALASTATAHPLRLPPVIRGTAPALHPEGFAWDPTRGAFLVGSVKHGTVSVVRPDGSTRTLVSDPHLDSTFGVHVDVRRGRFLVAYADLGLGDRTGGASGIGIFDLRTGRTLRLIDFDSMFVPTLEGIVKEGKPWEAGHEHFQPVLPDVRKFNGEMDRFSALVIYLSLIALVEDGQLWEICKANEENKLLLGSHDFRQLGISPACQELRSRYHIETLQKCLDELAGSLEESRMPRSLSEIIHTPRQQRGKSIVEYTALDLPVSLDHVVSAPPASQSFSAAPEPEPRRIPSAELPIPVAYVQGQETQAQQAPSNKKSFAAVGWLSIALLAAIILAALFTVPAPWLWVIPAIIGLVLIGVWRNSHSK